MQILSSALPGFRELRGPLITGYLWLVLAWILIEPDLDTRPEDPIGATLYDLGHDVGRLGVLLAVSIIAYLIGSISQEISNSLAGIARFFALFGIGLLSGPRTDRLDDLAARARERVRELRPSIPSDERLQEMIMEGLDDRYRQAESEAAGELNLPATLLVGERPQLFAEVDRLRAEGELRLAVVPPLTALIVTAAILQSGLWLVGLLLVLALFRQGLTRDAESRFVIANALYTGHAPSPALERYDRWVQVSLDTFVREQAARFGT